MARRRSGASKTSRFRSNARTSLSSSCQTVRESAWAPSGVSSGQRSANARAGVIEPRTGAPAKGAQRTVWTFSTAS